jgi:PilX N-terminal
MYTHSTHKQSGIVLFTSLVFLISLTLLAVSGMQSSIMNTRLASNAQDINIAFQSAESANAFSISQMAWVNEALTNLGGLTTHKVDLQNSKIEAISNMKASTQQLPGYSMDVDSGITYYQLEVDSTATLKDSAKRRTVQGYGTLSPN